MDREKVNQIIRISEKYYMLGMSQEQIADSESISISTVSRILKKAMEEGYIRISINYPIQSDSELSNKMKQAFGLKEVFVCQSNIESFESTIRSTCTALADDLPYLVKNNCTIGISWGRTMNMLAEVLTETRISNTKVVQLNGSISKRTISTGAEEIVSKLAKVTHGTGYMFPVPAVVDSKVIAEVMRSESSIKYILDLGTASDLVVFSIGNISKGSILYEAGYINDDEYKSLIEMGAVGDIASRYFDINGRIVDHNINERVVGIDLDEMKHRKNKVAVAVGAEKAKAIVGALRGGYVDRLYIDEITAERVMDLNQQK